MSLPGELSPKSKRQSLHNHGYEKPISASLLLRSKPPHQVEALLTCLSLSSQPSPQSPKHKALKEIVSSRFACTVLLVASGKRTSRIKMEIPSSGAFWRLRVQGL